LEGGRFIDNETGTEWSILGEGMTGPLEGRHLEPIVSVNYFWFAWAAFYPDTHLYDQDAS
jgi:hypothetical protein